MTDIRRFMNINTNEVNQEKNSDEKKEKIIWTIPLVEKGYLKNLNR